MTNLIKHYSNQLSRTLLKNRKRAGLFSVSIVTIFAAFFLFAACGEDSVTEEKAENVLEASAVHNPETGEHLFDLSTDEISSGWTTFRFTNGTGFTHFLIIEKMPMANGEQKTVEDSKAEVVPVFQNIMDNINGKKPSFPDAGSKPPAWYSNLVFMGGPGLTSSGETSKTTVNLAPGTYVVECYVKNEDGIFHSAKGMVEGLTVTNTTNEASPPESSLQLSISSKDGITVNGLISEAGEHTVEMRFEDQKSYAHQLGHDIQLVSVGDSASVDKLASWMNYASPGGLATPAPSGFTFLGGAQDMPADSTAYITVNFEPGKYAWIAEVPDPAGKDMLKTFTIE